MCVVCVLILCTVKRLKLHFREFISTRIPLDFQGEVPCSGKISVCLCALTVFLETDEAEFWISLWSPSQTQWKEPGV